MHLSDMFVTKMFYNDYTTMCTSWALRLYYYPNSSYGVANFGAAMDTLIDEDAMCMELI